MAFRAALLMVLVLTFGAVLVRCGSSDDEDDSTETVLELGISAAANSLDDQTTTAGFTRLNRKPFYNPLIEFFTIPTAWAAACSGRPVASTCQSGVRTKTYDECNLGLSAWTLDGDVTLTYSDPACGMATNGNTVTRLFDLTTTGPFNGTTTSVSDDHTTWDGVDVGGGSVLETTSAGYTLKILGSHRVRTRSTGGKIFDYSIVTPADAPITVEGGLDWGSRKITGGKITIHHNLAEFTTTLEITSELQQGTGCCYPSSGTVSFTQTGTQTASGTCTYESCGKGTVQVGSTRTTFEYTSCQ